MRSVLLIRFGEVHLKGLNRPYFLKRLRENVHRAVEPLGGRAWLSDSRIYVADARDMREAAERVCRVFGVHSVSPAWELEKDFEAIRALCLTLTRDLAGTFKVFARRSDKRFPVDSMTMQRDLGEAILAHNPNLRVDVHAPEHEVCVEIRDMAYVYADKMPAVGGLPMGTGGRALLLLSGGIDSPVAGFSLMKRGVVVSAVHFHSFPYTSERAKEKVLTLARLLGAYSGAGMKVYVVPFTNLQMRIHEACPDALSTILMRRYMMRIAERLARVDGALALVTGESLGQVASQTMEALSCTDSVVGMPVFRPLIGADKLEIIDTAVKIGTYDTSILPYEDCCTVFTPRHPTTKPREPMLAQAEQALDGEALIAEALAGTEVVLV